MTEKVENFESSTQVAYEVNEGVDASCVEVFFWIEPDDRVI